VNAKNKDKMASEGKEKFQGIAIVSGVNTAIFQ